MKIVFLTYDAPGHISGVDSWLKRIVPELVSRDLDVSIVFTTRGDLAKLKKVQFFTDNGIDTHLIKFENYPYAIERTQAVLGLLKKLKPDIVVPGFVLSAINTIKDLKEAGILSVAILHSDDRFYAAITSEFIEKESPWRFDAAVGVSRFLAAKLEGFKLERNILPTYHIPYGVPVAGFAAAFSEPLRLIYVGRLEEEQKRISELTMAFCKVANKYQGVIADIYGTGAFEHKVRDIINENGNNKVAYKGYMDSEKAASILSQYHVIVLLSDYEGLPVSLLEGMSCGLVPVCLNMQSGITDVVEHMKNGIIVHNRGEDFFSAIELLRNKELWETLSFNSRKTIEATYSISATADLWVKLFYNLIKNRQGVPREIVMPETVLLPGQHPDLVWENYYKPNIFIRAYKWLLRKIK